MLLLFPTSMAKWLLFRRKLLIRFTVHVFPKRLSICVYASLPFWAKRNVDIASYWLQLQSVKETSDMIFILLSSVLRRVLQDWVVLLLKIIQILEGYVARNYEYQGVYYAAVWKKYTIEMPIHSFSVGSSFHLSFRSFVCKHLR